MTFNFNSPCTLGEEEQVKAAISGLKRSPKPPPKTCDEWLSSSSAAGHLVSADGTLFIPSKDKVVKWPIHPPHLDFLVAAPQLPDEDGKTVRTIKKHKKPGDTILGSLSDIKKDLEKHAPWNPSMFDDIEVKLQKLEESVDISAYDFVDDEERKGKESVVGGLANVTDFTFMTEVSAELLRLRKFASSTAIKDGQVKSQMDVSGQVKSQMDVSGQVKSQMDLNERHVKSVEFPGLSSDPKLIPLPNKLDPLTILNTVNSLTSLPNNLRLPWKRIFFSNEFVSILQNTFWWMWLDYFKPNKRIQALLFDQIAQDFVSIFLQMDGKHKDAVFMRLPVVLSQALYSAFCLAFPGSNQELNTPEFLDYIANTTSEWMIGVKSPPRQWQEWPRHFLNPYFLSLRLDSKGVSSQMPKHTSSMEKDKSILSLQLSKSTDSRQSDVATVSDASPRLEYTPTRLGSKAATIVGLKGVKKDSSESLVSLGSNFSVSQLEAGPLFECVRFSIYGRSPLLQHFLYHHNLTGTQDPTTGLSISRTQVKEIPEHGITYKQVVKGQERKAKKLYQEYQDKVDQSHREIAQVRNKYKAQVRKSEKLNQHLLQHRHEVARIAERLVASKVDGLIDIQNHMLG